MTAGTLDPRPQLVARFWMEDRDDIVLLAQVEHLWRGDDTVTMSLTNVEIDNHLHVQLLFSLGGKRGPTTQAAVTVTGSSYTPRE